MKKRVKIPMRNAAELLDLAKKMREKQLLLVPMIWLFLCICTPGFQIKNYEAVK